MHSTQETPDLVPYPNSDIREILAPFINSGNPGLIRQKSPNAKKIIRSQKKNIFGLREEISTYSVP